MVLTLAHQLSAIDEIMVSKVERPCLSKPETPILPGLLLRSQRRGGFGRRWFVGVPADARSSVILCGAPFLDYRPLVQDLHLQLLAVPAGLPRRSGDIVPGRRVGVNLNLVVGGDDPLDSLARAEIAVVGAKLLAARARYPYGDRFRVLVRSLRGGTLLGLAALCVLLFGPLRSRLADFGCVDHGVAEQAVAYRHPDQEPQNLTPAYAQPSLPHSFADESS